MSGALSIHALGLVEGHAPALTWMAARFAGIPAIGNCLLPGQRRLTTR
jgi:hypothetical protein